MFDGDWTDAARAFVIENYATKSAREIATLLTQRTGHRFTKNKVIGFAYRQGLEAGGRCVSLRKAIRLPGTMLTDDDLRGCRHIEGNPLPLRHGMYCCKPTMTGTDYCEAHCAQNRIAGSGTVPYVGRAAML